MRNKKGFTLIELLVVIAIIGLLATIAVVALNSARTSSRDAKRIADVRQVQTGLEMYFNQFASYPTCTSIQEVSAMTGAACTSNGLTTYISGITNINDPTSSTGGCTPAQATRCDYSYLNSGATDYSIYFSLEQASGSLPLGAHTASSSGLL
ncbi:MAG: hypothetical protein COT24_04570 [Candidatus Kerfeldbacteria bacterium CG08_land_8_20_14_0_20_40_16]|uniref:Type II secretion system protein GspG C-terminal domain-containing protein n=1 Tax=Candidatus Kerfeldbacteria bacterium CG08_land_8_20_14_0_20_40_16 TaxID=2014244 RepID=A0A2H0YUZ4_9BACT|nr:MAG: hypothetical protein COT24_04570 [Candidatus Kerfeldbacteria bacterium CG08_land_8_20_14_0_20_40_16]